MDYDTMTMDEYEREIARRVNHRRREAMAEAIGCATMIGFAAVMAFLWLVATPAQVNGDGETAEAEVAK